MTSEKRIALITGASRGIGKAAALALLERDFDAYLCSRSPEAIEAARQELAERFGEGRVHARAVDVQDQAQVDAFVSHVAGEAGRIDCLVNNAGLGIFAPVDELTGDEWRQTLRTNLDGAFYFLSAVAKVMKAQGSGDILNIASLASRNPFAGGSAYNASKFGLLGLSDAAMLDLRPFGVRVSAILPGSVDTDFRTAGDQESSWMLTSEDIAKTIVDLIAYPARALPSRVEIRPTLPPGAKR